MLLSERKDLDWLFNIQRKNNNIFCLGKNGRNISRINYYEAELLGKYVLSSKSDILEIGICKGGTTTLISEYIKDSDINLYSVDITFKNIKKECYEILKKRNNVKLLNQSSNLKIDNKWGLVWIDGDHSYSGVKKDVETHFENLIDDGYIVFHDANKKYLPPVGYSELPVVRYIEVFEREYNVKLIDSYDSLLVYQKISDKK